jgi:hypothetical protein
MIVTPVEYSISLAPSAGRSEGIHVSSIIRNIAIENKILETNELDELSLVDSREITDPIALLRIGLGIGWERFYIPDVLSRLYNVDDHPPEAHHDGVFLSRDGESVSVIITTEGPKWAVVVHEVKCTYKSVRTVMGKSGLATDILLSQCMWLAQIKAYCIARNTRFAVLHVLFVCGDYSYPIRPINLCWQLEFTQAELDNNWAMLVDYKDMWLAKQARENDGMMGVGE